MFSQSGRQPFLPKSPYWGLTCTGDSLVGKRSRRPRISWYIKGLRHGAVYKITLSWGYSLYLAQFDTRVIYSLFCLGNVVPNLRCFVAQHFLAQICTVISLKCSGLKMCECKQNDKYQVWAQRVFVSFCHRGLCQRTMRQKYTPCDTPWHPIDTGQPPTPIKEFVKKKQPQSVSREKCSKVNPKMR